MKTKLLTEGAEKTYAVVFDAGDEVISGLTQFAEDEGLDAAHFTALGAFERATLGYFDLDTQDYVHIPVAEQVEVLSLIGDIALKDGNLKVHAHVVVGKRDGTAHGGHILEPVSKLGQAPGHETNHGDIDERFRRFGQSFIIASKTTITNKPGESPFNNPAFG